MQIRKADDMQQRLVPNFEIGYYYLTGSQSRLVRHLSYLLVSI